MLGRRRRWLLIAVVCAGLLALAWGQANLCDRFVKTALSGDTAAAIQMTTFPDTEYVRQSVREDAGGSLHGGGRVSGVPIPTVGAPIGMWWIVPVESRDGRAAGAIRCAVVVTSRGLRVAAVGGGH